MTIGSYDPDYKTTPVDCVIMIAQFGPGEEFWAMVRCRLGWGLEKSGCADACRVKMAVKQVMMLL